MKSICSILLIWLFLSILTWNAFARKLTELHGANFELALSSYRYLAVLFYDDSAKGASLQNQWEDGANLIEFLPDEAEIAQARIFVAVSINLVLYPQLHLFYR